MKSWDAMKVRAALELLEAAAPAKYTGDVHVHFKSGRARVFDPSGHTTRADLDAMVDAGENHTLVSGS